MYHCLCSQVEHNSVGIAGDDDPEPEVFVDPLAIAAARQAQLSKLQVKEVQALIHILVMAAQGHGAFAATDKAGDIFDELIQETNKSAAKTFFERGTNTSSKLTGCLISASDESHAANSLFPQPLSIS